MEINYQHHIVFELYWYGKCINYYAMKLSLKNFSRTSDCKALNLAFQKYPHNYFNGIIIG